jgi:hypothetical protein
MPPVLIRGDGIAAFGCLRLLGTAGVPVAMERLGRPKLPAIMLGDATQKLLCDVFGRADLFAGLPHIRRRVVSWGSEKSKPLTLPHSAVVVSEDELWRRIQEVLPETIDINDKHFKWTIFASTPLERPCSERHFGSRWATASPCHLAPGHDIEACWIESLESGWMFLLPSGEQAGWLLSVGGSPEVLFEMSSLIRSQIAELVPARGTFVSHPRTSIPLAGEGWLACGSAALGFDPLCGDGTGNTLREAILASAVIRAVRDGGDAESLSMHYQVRLLASLQRHLALCFDFYKTGPSGKWWEDQLSDLRYGIEWCGLQIRGNSRGDRQNRQRLSALSEHDLKLLTHFINSF